MAKNLLVELVKRNNGCISIEKAKEILGAGTYERCWKEIQDSEDWNQFCQNGDNVPTHVCSDDWSYDWFCDKVDSALESVGVLSPRTKGLTVH